MVTASFTQLQTEKGLLLQFQIDENILKVLNVSVKL